MRGRNSSHAETTAMSGSDKIASRAPSAFTTLPLAKGITGQNGVCPSSHFEVLPYSKLNSAA
jgi:hypothetical protein